MPITEILERNAKEYPDDICLVEINKCGLVERWMKRKT